MINYLFLDIDGVININDGVDNNLNSEKLDILSKIVFDNDMYIVLSSSWRKINVPETKEYLKSKGFPKNLLERLIGVTIRAYHYLDKSKKVHMSIPRGVEIKQWIDANIDSDNGKNYMKKIKGYHYNYVIIDDDSDFLLEQKDNFIRTTSEKGLLDEHLEMVKNILKPIEVERTVVFECSDDIFPKNFEEAFEKITGKTVNEWRKTCKNISFYEDHFITSDGIHEYTTDAYSEIRKISKLKFL